MKSNTMRHVSRGLYLDNVQHKPQNTKLSQTHSCVTSKLCGECTSPQKEVKYHLPADTRVMFDYFTSITYFQATR